jgi:E3 ubiquitin-protein ligase NRDP1
MQETNKNTLIQSKGIPFQRLINKENYTNFLDIIQCKICFNILKNPYDCSTCGNSFCYNCISNLLKSHKKCPFNCQNVTIKPSSYGIISYLSKLNFYCKNKDYGCNEIISYQNLDIHEKECKYFYTICPNGQCNKKLLWDSLENHLKNECFYTLIKCQYCNQDFNRIEYNEHLKNCKSFQNYLSFSINKNTNDDIKKHQKNFENLLNSLPVIKDASFLTFMKMMLYQFNLNNEIIYNHISNLQNEIKLISSEIKKINSNNKNSFDNLNKEIKNLNLEIKKENKDNLYLQNIFSPIPQKTNYDNDSLLLTGEIAKNFLDIQERFSDPTLKKDNNSNDNNIDINNEKKNQVNLHKKYESSKLPDNKFGNIVYEEEENENESKNKEGRIISFKKVKNNKSKNEKEKIHKRHYSKPFINYINQKRYKNILLDKLNQMIKIIDENTNKIIIDINKVQENYLEIILKNIKDKNWEDEIIYPKQFNYKSNFNEKIEDNQNQKPND